MLLSGGQLAPIGLADEVPLTAVATYYPNVGVQLAQRFSSYSQIYRSQVWVAALVNKVAFATARLPLKPYLRTDTGRADARDTPLGALLRNPNRRHDPFFLWLWTSSTFEIYGEALWVKSRPSPGEPPTEVWPVHPSNIYTRRTREPETVNGRLVPPGSLVYRYQAGNASVPLAEWPAEDVVHFKAYNPQDQVRGLSRLEPLRPTLVNEDAMRGAQAAMWVNGARPSVALQHPGRLSEPAQRRLAESWSAMHGGVDNWAKAAVLEEGVTATVLQLSAEEMQYIEGRKMNREEACAIFDVPPPVVHILDQATFSNITEQMRSMYRDTMAPRLALYESVLDTQLRPDFDPAGRLYAEFLMDEVLRGSFEERVAAYEVMSRIGGMMPSEVREKENLPDAGPETHRLYVNAATIPLGEVTKRAQMVQEGAEVVPIAQDTQQPAALPTKTLSICPGCDDATAEVLSRKGLCRSCEGKQARAAGRMREIV